MPPKRKAEEPILQVVEKIARTESKQKKKRAPSQTLLSKLRREVRAKIIEKRAAIKKLEADLRGLKKDQRSIGGARHRRRNPASVRKALKEFAFNSS